MPVAVKTNFQEYDPRHRLTGAVVLILLAIILLPMLLTRSPEEKPAEIEPVVMEVTKEGNKVFVSRITSVPAPKKSPDTVSEKPVETAANAEQKKNDKEAGAKEVSSALIKPMSSSTAAKPSTKKAATEKSQSATTGSKASAKKTGAQAATSKKAVTKKSSTIVAGTGWILQVGVFSQSANAKKKVSELKKKGFNAKSGKVKTSKGEVTKVWIGPFEERKSAEKMQDRLQHKTRQRGMVVKK